MRRDVPTSVLAALIGLWFLASAFMWERTTASRLNSIIVGALCVAVAWGASRAPVARWLYFPLGCWMIASVWIVPHHDRFTIWNDVAVGIGVLLIPTTALLFPEPSARRVPG